MLLELTLIVLVILGIVTLIQLRKVQVAMSANSDALVALRQDVASESSAVDSAIVLINGLANRLTSALNTKTGDELVAEIQSIRDEVNNHAVSLGQAVAAGTAAENDSSNFPAATSAVGETSSGESTGTTSSDISGDSTTGLDSSQPSSSDSTSSNDTSGSAESGSTSSSPSGDEVGNAQPEAGEVTTPVSPAGDGTADVAPPEAGSDTVVSEESPDPVETVGDAAVETPVEEEEPPVE